MRAILLTLVFPLMAAAQMLSAIVSGGAPAVPESAYSIPAPTYSGSSLAKFGDDVTPMLSQSFTISPATSMHVTSVTLTLSKAGAPGGNIIVQLWNSGGGVLASSTTTLAGSSLTTTLTQYTFAFSSIPLATGTYFIGVFADGAGWTGTATDYYNLAYSSASSYSGGGIIPYPGGVAGSESTTDDAVFTVAGTAPSVPYTISQPTGTAQANFGTTTAQMKAQSFTPGSAMHVTSVTVKLNRTNTGGHADNVVVSLYTNNGGTTRPLTLIQASSTTLVGSTISTSATSYTFAFPSVALSASTKYWIVMSRSGSGDDTNYYQATYSASGNVYAGGGFEAYNSGWAAESSIQDFVFTVTGVTP